MKKMLGLLAALWCLIAAGPALARPNVILISIDSLRPDHMSSFGYPRATTPTLDRIAAQGTTFTEATTLVPLTSPSVSTLFTSVPVEKHGIKLNGLKLSKSYVSLPELLSREGYTTAAVMGCWALYHTRSGLSYRFDYYLDDGMAMKLELTGEQMTERAFAFLDRAPPQPLFFWIHYLDPHQPHKAYPGFNFAGDGMDSNKTRDAYDSEVAYDDHQVARLLQKLKERGYLDNALIIILADHGEGLLEHGFIGHGRGLYEYILRVPVIMAGPGIPVGARLPGHITLMDVTPTILSYLGIAIPDQMEGRDLMPVIRGQAQVQNQPIFYQTCNAILLDFPGRAFVAKLTRPSVLALRDGNLKLVYDPQFGRYRMFDLDADPREKNNLAPLKGPDYQRMVKMLDDWRKLNFSHRQMLKTPD
jgi:choline-sulfatase